MKYIYLPKNLKFFLLVFAFIVTSIHHSQNFSQSNLNFNGIGSVDMVTSLMYGPDNRLYLTEYKGLVKILTIDRIENSNYVLTAMETLNGIQTIQDYNDDGTLHSSTFRETTGITVTGTASNPIIYVTSSDFRIGGGTGGGGGDVGLDTNSGIITRFTWNGTSWDVVDIVRGLPRSEENHGTHGLEFTQINGVDYLIVCSGGNTNGGSPSKNFTYLPEYALSASIISINLSMIESLPIQNDNGRSYIYDLPTLDDPTRLNENGIEDPNDPDYNGIDINDPFGGNDGLNQAKIIPGGPVQIFSPGYRNSYDLVVTESGGVYVTENGANGGWGGFPINEGSGNVTNNYDPTEPGSSSPSGGEQINNEDQLHLVTTDIQNYTFGSLYGGHPNPIRANPSGAGLFTAPAQLGLDGAVFRTNVYDPDGSTIGSTTDSSIALPADWPPVPISSANPVEGDWRGPGEINPDGPVDNSILVWGTNTNAIDEYTASNFDGIMKGNLLAGTNTGVLRRVELNSNGTVDNFTASFVSGLGGNALGLTCNSDSDIFPGTIWVGNFSNTLIVLEPQDFVTCIQPEDVNYDANADYDNDGYTNQDEVDNLTDPCNGGSQPTDFDKSNGGSLISNLNDDDDDDDGILDQNDPFQIGDFTSSGSDAFILPVTNELFSDSFLGGYLGLGMTGMMNNGDSTNGNWLNWLDRRDDLNDPNPNDILGGAIGAMTMQMTSGSALGTQNNQEKAFQYGVQVDQNTGVFTVSGTIVNFNQPLQLYGNISTPDGELGFFIGDGTQSNYIKLVARKQGLRVQQEINDIPQTPIDLPIDVIDRPDGTILFSFVIDPVNGSVSFEYTFDNEATQTIGSILAEGSILDAIQLPNNDLAVGFIGTSNVDGVELEGTWGVLNVTKNTLNPISVDSITNQTNNAGEVLDGSFSVIANGGDGSLNFSANGLPPGLSIDSNSGIIDGTISFLAANNSPYSVTITVDDSDGDNTDVILSNFTWTITTPAESTSIIRVNTGGNFYTATDSEADWESNSAAGSFDGLNYSVNTGKVYSNGISNLTRHASIPDYIDEQTFSTIFATERYDEAATPEMEFTFAIPSDNYIINIYLCNAYDGINSIGERVFDIAIEGSIVQSNLDLVDLFGHQVAGMLSFPVSVTDDLLNIEFLHGLTENPLVNAIEIRSFTSEENQIIVDNISNQFNNVDDLIDGTPNVVASGGDGNLVFTATGLPTGLTIDSITGNISGTIASNANQDSPFNVTITVDDNDFNSDDHVQINFNWFVSNPVDISWQDKEENESYTARHDCAAVQSGDKFYLFGGRESAKTLDIYDYTSNTWTSLVDSAPLEFNHFQAVDYQGLIWVVGAFKTNSYPNEEPEDFIWIFNPVSQEWIQGAEIPENRRRGSAGLVVHNDKFYLVGGNTIGHNGGYVPWFDEFDPATGTWTILDDAPRPRDHFHAEMIGNKLYAAGGRLTDASSANVFKPVISEVDVFDFTAGTWSTLPANQNLPTPRAGASVANYNGKLLIIGGEVAPDVSEFALDTTEEYNPITETWSTLPNLIHGRHGTQAIKSGNGIFLIAGSPNSGNGAQKNMEFYGTDSPSGNPSIASTISTVSQIIINGSNSTDVILDVTGGNVGLLVQSINITGTNASDFLIDSGIINNGLINANSSHTLSISYTGSINNASADLVINYGFNSNLIVPLTGNQTEDDTAIIVNNIPNQANNTGDSLDGSLGVVASGGDGNLTFSASGLPGGISIEPTNGQIGGTIASDADSNSPYNVTITVDDSDADTNDAVTINFSWVIGTNQTLIVTENVPNQANNAGDVLDGSLTVVASGGDGDLSFSALGLPNGATIDPVTGNINGTIASDADINSPYSVTITVDDSDTASDDAVSLTFNWTINPVDTPIIVENILDQANNAGDVLDGSLTVVASGGDGDLSFSASGLPDSVSIDPVTGSFTGTISAFADLDSPYNVAVTVDDTDSLTNDAVTLNFVWTISGSSIDSNPLFRVNAGGSLINATDASNVDWEANSTSNAFAGSNYSVNTGKAYTHNVTNLTRDASIPEYIDNATFNTIFNTERYDVSSDPEMTFSFDVPNADYIVNLYMCNTYNGIDGAGERIFDIAIENNIVTSNLDLVEQFGHRVAVMLTFPVTVNDGNLDIEFLHSVVENPLINAIEIRSVAASSSAKLVATKNQTLSTNNNDTIEFKGSQVKLYPNPTSLVSYIKVLNKNITLSKIDIYDISGRLVKSYNESNLNATQGTYKIDVSNLQQGTYIINLITSKNETLNYKKLIVKKN